MQTSQPRFAMLLAACLLLLSIVHGHVTGQSPEGFPPDDGNDARRVHAAPANLGHEVSRSSSTALSTGTSADEPSTTSEITPSPAKTSTSQPANAKPVPARDGLTGNLLLARAVRDIAQHRSIVANIRHRLRLFGHELVGSGTYQQVDIGPDRLLRLELKIPLDDQITSVTQICDARFLWIQRTMPSDHGVTQTEISRIDLDKVRSAAASQIHGKNLFHDGLLLGQGGIPQLLIELERHFAFREVRAAIWQDVPVWITWGAWKPEILNRLIPHQEGDIADPPRVTSLPPHMPHLATVVLGRDDLLPYQIEYRRKQGTADENGFAQLDDADTVPILTMELFAVEVGGAIDPRQFAFNSGDRLVVDGTSDYLLRATSPDVRREE